jgi:hypothetical protein
MSRSSPARSPQAGIAGEIHANRGAKPESGDDLEWIATQARAVNALRELGQFDAALALREKKLPLQSLDVPVPVAAALSFAGKAANTPICLFVFAKRLTFSHLTRQSD